MYNSVRFEWDADKNRSNQKKHAGMDFETASRAFADPSPMLRKDSVIDGVGVGTGWALYGRLCW